MDQSSKVLLLTRQVQMEGKALPYVRFCFLHGTVLWMARLTQVMQAGKEYLVIWKENKIYLIWAANFHKDKLWNTTPINDTCHIVPLLTAQEVTRYDSVSQQPSLRDWCFSSSGRQLHILPEHWPEQNLTLQGHLSKCSILSTGQFKSIIQLKSDNTKLLEIFS